MPETIAVDVISDTICPWCYIGKRRLEKALAQRPDLSIEIIWRPFQLDATIPKGGVGRASYLERKFGGEEAASAIYGRIEEAGREEGISFAFDRIRVTPNTIDSHRLIRWAAEAGVQDVVVEDLFLRYFTQGRDVGDADELASVAGHAELDPDLVRERLEGDDDVEAVEEEIALAQRIGVTGVPCFIVAKKYAVMGAQPAEAIVEALDRAGAEASSATGTHG